MSYSAYAQAGFFDWLGVSGVSKESTNQLAMLIAGKNWALDSTYGSSASSTPEDAILSDEEIKEDITQKEPVGKKGTSAKKNVKTFTVVATGYSSTPDQTDDSPFITASGTHVRDGIIAANVYTKGQRIPFGTLVRIPEIFGDKVFVVEDRMNSRYTNNVDIWFPERNLAKVFGIKKVTIEIVDES